MYCPRCGKHDPMQKTISDEDWPINVSDANDIGESILEFACQYCNQRWHLPTNDGMLGDE